LGSGLLYSYRFNELFPFDVGMVTATIDDATLRGILSIANIDASTPVRPLRSNFVYASINPRGRRLYTLVTSVYVAQYAGWLLGTTEIEFEPVPETTVKAALRDALERQTAQD
jgi:hypothetical protein